MNYGMATSRFLPRLDAVPQADNVSKPSKVLLFTVPVRSIFPQHACDEMNVPALYAEDFDLLQALIIDGPRRNLDPALRGRLALYDLIDENPSGWVITEKGKSLLARPRVEAISPAIDPQEVRVGGHNKFKRALPL